MANYKTWSVLRWMAVSRFHIIMIMKSGGGIFFPYLLFNDVSFYWIYEFSSVIAATTIAGRDDGSFYWIRDGYIDSFGFFLTIYGEMKSLWWLLVIASNWAIIKTTLEKLIHYQRDFEVWNWVTLSWRKFWLEIQSCFFLGNKI